ncbi:MAG: helix-turn-helix transcriptional regulator [Clostridiaceae bacterium]|nr:helix-turn-helix transcriptional regulator [Clostridiaceae bacterium]
MKFGEKLQTLRRAKGLSQEQLAEALGVTRQAVSKWELNASLPDVEKLLVLSDFFQVSTDYLLKESMVTPPAPAQEFVPPPRRRLNVKLLVGAILTGASSLALFVVWVLSRVYPATYIVQDPMQNYTQVWTGYAGFVRLHDLSPLTISCWVLLFIGLVLLFWKPLDRRFALAQRLRRLSRHGKKVSSDEPSHE